MLSVLLPGISGIFGMSHFTTLTLAIESKESLVECLEELGYTVDTAATSVRGYSGSKHAVSLKIKMTSGYDIGFAQNFITGGYDVIADWWGVNGIKEKEFNEQLITTYGERTVKAFAEANRFNILEVNEHSDHRELVLVRRDYS